MFFFFKQKTAYEMRISDWSSDVCSSDLRSQSARSGPSGGDERSLAMPASACAISIPHWRALARNRSSSELRGRNMRRSEEHTSELQSLMRISYAVFCLKKKITNKNIHATLYIITLEQQKESNCYY